MNPIYSTETIAQQLHSLRLPYASLIARALSALMTARKATIHQIAQLMQGEQTTEAKRQQLRRFLDQPSMTPERWAKAIVPLLPTKEKWVLSLDRTNWKWGKEPVNLLVLAVVCYGCAIPLLWVPLPKEGNSHTRERIALMQRFLTVFGKDCLRFVTADREFIGEDWILWLMRNKIAFRIRIKAKEYLARFDGEERHAFEWFTLRACSCKPKAMQLWGLWVYVGGKRLSHNRDEYLIVISNEFGDILEDYRLRWKIETLFQALKGRGFALESCRASSRTSCS